MTIRATRPGSGNEHPNTGITNPHEEAMATMRFNRSLEQSMGGRGYSNAYSDPAPYVSDLGAAAADHALAVEKEEDRQRPSRPEIEDDDR